MRRQRAHRIAARLSTLTFEGHVRVEQWFFLCSSCYMLLPALFLWRPALANFQLWSEGEDQLYVAPYMACVSHVCSILHWSDYKPGHWKQRLDVCIAGLTSLSVLAEAFCRAGAEKNVLQYRWLCLLMTVLGYLDVRHRHHFGTTHVTGSWIHYSLRCVGFLLMTSILGKPASAADTGLARLATWTAVHTLLHMYACYAAFRAFGLDQGGERKPLSRSACAMGLGASYAFMLTGLHFL